MIEVENLTKVYSSKSGIFGRQSVQAVRGISFHIPAGGAVSFIGESGCGKTTVGRILAGLESASEGVIRIGGQDVSRVSLKERQALFRTVQLIHQDPYQALNPARSVGQSLLDPLKVMAKTKRVGDSWIRDRANEVLTMVGLDPNSVIHKYPHMLSGGQRQRIVIARALTVEPHVLVADEAVSMIDVSLRLGVLRLLRNLREKLNIALLFITHDVAAARYVGRDGEVHVIYRGLILEKGETDDVIQHPQHPYTQALLSAVPVLKGLEIPGPDRYIPLKEMETREDVETGCLFVSRCPFARDICREKSPLLTGEGHEMACHFAQVRNVVAMPVVAD